MEELTRMLLTALWSFVGVVVLLAAVIVTIAVIARRRQRRMGELPAQQTAQLRVEIMEYARARTKSQDMRVDLNPFWRTKHLTLAQRYVVLERLLQDKDLRSRSSDDDAASGAVFLGAELLALPARHISLSELEWNRLKNDSAPRIHVQQGSGGIVQIGDYNSAHSVQEMSPEFILELVAALRHDASGAPAGDSERASSLADSLEIDLKKKRWSSIGETVKTVLSLASSGASLWATTSKLFLS